MSPCSKKLSDLKGKRFKKYVPSLLQGAVKILTSANSVGKPQSLFAKLGKKNFESSQQQQTGDTGEGQ
jgi:hypothetical protein